MSWFLEASRLALALAVLRLKPPDISGKEHAEHLARMLSRKDPREKSRVEALEAEVVRLRQQLLLSKVHPGFGLENGDPAVASNEAPAPVRADDRSSHFEDSRCSNSNGNLADTQDASDASSVLPILASSHAGSSKSLVPHIQFLRRFLELKQLAEHGGLRTDLGKLGRDSSAISDSFSRLLDGLVASYSLPEHPFSDFMTRAVCAIITELLSDADVFRQILGKCLKKLEDSVKRLIDIVLNSSHLNRFQVQESISHALVSIGQCNRVRRQTISLLFREVSQFADELQHTDEIQAGRDTRYENIFFLCRALEQLLETGTGQGDAAAPSGCDGEEKEMFLQKLDQAIFHLCDEFPLFCIYLWRLGTLLNVAHMQIGGRQFLTEPGK
ncbi:meiosis-specific protein MEI4 [Zootoca vivipara]|uniref:meiosis-specific protein MEI4 n=1 Tax=Zootoca vivipara TaxID=8524 RepID=UPI0015902073|nr:meiosis-specific protein MEI4 [Zootoca vivipara]